MWLPRKIADLCRFLFSLSDFAKSTENCFKQLAAQQQALQLRNQLLTQRVGALEAELAALAVERRDPRPSLRMSAPH
jgi:hypothetical protein